MDNCWWPWSGSQLRNSGRQKRTCLRSVLNKIKGTWGIFEQILSINDRGLFPGALIPWYFQPTQYMLRTFRRPEKSQKIRNTCDSKPAAYRCWRSITGTITSATVTKVLLHTMLGMSKHMEEVFNWGFFPYLEIFWWLGWHNFRSCAIIKVSLTLLLIWFQWSFIYVIFWQLQSMDKIFKQTSALHGLLSEDYSSPSRNHITPFSFFKVSHNL